MRPVIATRPDGLGTRLLTILFGLRFSEQLGAPFSIYWPNFHDIHYPSNEVLLQQKDIEDIIVTERPIKDRADVGFVEPPLEPFPRYFRISDNIAGLKDKLIDEISPLIGPYDVIQYNVPEAVALAGSDASNELLIAKRNWERLNFSNDIVESFGSFSNQFNLGSSVAIHLRRGDILNMLKYEALDILASTGATQIFQRYIPLKTVAAVLRKDFSDFSQCIVCSESDSAAADLQELLPEVNVLNSNVAYAKNCNQRALLDLMILAGSSHLVSPFKSYFSECAATIGNCSPLNVGLDIPSLIDELITVLDGDNVLDLKSRKSIIYSYGYLNLWYIPDSEYRQELLDRAMSSDSEICRSLITS
jgi:hypothetical protein